MFRETLESRHTEKSESVNTRTLTNTIPRREHKPATEGPVAAAMTSAAVSTLAHAVSMMNSPPLS